MLTQAKVCAISVIFLTLFVNFIVAGLLINCVQLCLWLTIKPINPWLYRKINYHLLACLWNRKSSEFNTIYDATLQKCFYFPLEVLIIIDWSGSSFSVYTDTDTWLKLGQENALLILNHSNELDWLVAWVLGYQANILGAS